MAKPVKKRVLNASTATFADIADAQDEAAKRAEWTKAKKDAERNCDLCGKAYHPSRRWQTYCSSMCRVTAFQNKKSNNELELLDKIQMLEAENASLREQLDGK